MKRFFHAYSTLFLFLTCMCADLYATGRRASSAYWLLKQSPPGTVLFSGNWYPAAELAGIISGNGSRPVLRGMLATCGGIVGGTGLTDDFDGDGVCNSADIDDDNDGVVDATESPSCFYTVQEAGTIAVVKTPLTNDDGTNVDLPFMHDGVTTTVTASNNVIAINQAVNGAVVYNMDYNTPVRLTSVSVYGTTWGTSATAMLQGSNDNSTWDNLMTAATAATANPKTFTVNNNAANSYQYYRLVKIAGTSTPAITTYEVTAVHNSAGYNPSAHAKPTCLADVDSDSFNNHQDLDSDGDGCSDSFESGAVATETANHQFTGADANEDGLVDAVDGAVQDGAPEYTYLIYAYDQTRNLCTDTDGDGVGDLVDIDDDNDGVLDAIESPGCYYDIDQWTRDTEYVKSDFTFMAAGPFSEAVDGINNNGDFFAMVSGCTDCILDKALVEYQPPLSYPIPVDEISIIVGINNAFAQSSFVLEGFDGSNWIALSAAQAMSTANTTYTFTNTLHPNALYYKFRVKGANATGDVANGTRLHEIYFRSNGYVRSLQGNPACVGEDYDGDGIANHLDLDSDGDGCSDAKESGAVGEAGVGNVSDATGTNPGGPVNLTQARINSPYGPNGFADVVQSASDVNAFKTTYNSIATYSSTVNGCSDNDNDGVADITDLDDDNDGIPDCTEGYEAKPAGTPISNLSDGPGGANGTDPKLASYVAAEDGTVLMDATVTVGMNVSFLLSSGWVAPISGQNNVLIKQVQVNGTGWINYHLDTKKTGAYGFIIKNRADVVVTPHTTEWPSLLLDYDTDLWQATLVGYRTVAGADATPPAGLSIGGVVESGTDYPGISNHVFEVKLTPLREIQTGSTTDIRLWHIDAANVESPNIAMVFDSCLDMDTDGDGIPNRLDLDSDGDGCSDAVESGVSGTLQPGTLVNPGGSVPSDKAIAAEPYGANGLADGVETSAGSGQINYTSTYHQYALDALTKVCEDTDGDGKPNYVDLDDDNDGILDAVESPGCYFTAAEANVIATVTSIHTSLDDDQTDHDIQLLHDGSLTGTFNFSAPYTLLPGTEIFTIKYPSTIKLGSLVISQRMSSTTNAVGKLYGSNDGVNYLEVPTTAVVNINTATNVTFSPTAAAPAYRFYQIRAAGITTNAAGNIVLSETTIAEITSTLASGYVPSANPKPSCSADADGDGIVNHLDLDSDGDGCPDATEGGGGFTTANLVESNLPGGNSGTGYTGAVTFGVDDNLGNSVDSNGVPMIANGGQPIGQSQVAGTPCPENEPCELEIGGTVLLDMDGAANGVNGSVINGSSAGLYMSLVNAGAVQSVAAIQADGTYRFSGLAAGTYQLVLSINASGSLTSSLPNGVISVSEGGAKDPVSGNSMGDGSVDGMTSVTLSCPGAASDTLVDFGIDKPMPVTIVSFNAVQAQEGTLLQWRTADEKDFDRFEIEQSALPQAGFTKIGTVKGGGSAYTFLDATGRNGASYYRLKMVDTDGSFAYSRIVTVTSWNGIELYKVYPNPSVERTVYISSMASIDSYKVFDAWGREVHVRMTAEGKTYKFTFGKDIQPGVYVVSYETGGRQFTQQFVLSH